VIEEDSDVPLGAIADRLALAGAEDDGLHR
jgi:hypothetical protein